MSRTSLGVWEGNIGFRRLPLAIKNLSYPGAKQSPGTILMCRGLTQALLGGYSGFVD